MGHHISRVECIQILDLKYSNHLNTEHLKSEHLTLQTLFCLVFKWFDRKTRRTIWIHDILDHKTDIFCPVFRPPFKIRSIWQPDMFGPFKCQTCQVFRRLLYISFQKLTRHKPFKVLYLDKQVCNSGRSTMWRNCMQWIWEQGFGFCPGVCVSGAVVVLWCRDFFSQITGVCFLSCWHRKAHGHLQPIHFHATHNAQVYNWLNSKSLISDS